MFAQYSNCSSLLWYSCRCNQAYSLDSSKLNDFLKRNKKVFTITGSEFVKPSTPVLLFAPSAQYNTEQSRKYILWVKLIFVNSRRTKSKINWSLLALLSTEPANQVFRLSILRLLSLCIAAAVSGTFFVHSWAVAFEIFNSLCISLYEYPCSLNETAF